MPQPKKGHSLASSPRHQQLMLRNLARSLFEHERVKTTQAKAKLLRPYAERLITKAKGGSLHERRQVLSVIEDRNVVHKLFDEIGPRFSERNGGYTRVLKLGTRGGDGAEMALIELVDQSRRTSTSSSASTTEEGGGRRRRLRRRRGAAGAPEAGAATDDAELEDDSPEDEPPADEEPSAPEDVEADGADAEPAEEEGRQN